MKQIKLEKPDSYTLKRCQLFADYSAGSSADEYARRNQIDLEKIKLDIYRGKVAEYMVYNYLVSRGKSVSMPDLEIYNKHHKSFDADLVSDGVNLHVKSHFVNPRFPVSWVFQKQDKITTEKHSDDYLCLVVMTEDWNNGLYIKQSKLVTFKEPKKESLKSSKVCVYESDLLLTPIINNRI